MKKINLALIVLVSSLLILAGCYADTTGNDNRMSRSNLDPSKNGAPGATNSTNSLGTGNATNSANSMNSNAANKDNSFMMEAAQGGMAEVELGKLAASKAQSQEVKQFGQKMVADHSKANTELKELAAKKGVTLPTDVSAKHKADMEKLNGLSGAAFDKEYVRMMVADHEKDVSAFQTEADSGTDADVKAFASKTLPTLKMHLEMIRSINGKMK